MRIYIDIGHPAYAHAFRHFIVEMKQHGHQVLVSARDKDITYCLLRAWDIDFTGRGTGHRHPGRGVDHSGKPSGCGPWLWLRNIAALIGRLLGKPVLTFEDTEDVSVLHSVNRALSTRMIVMLRERLIKL